jgi:uncharacterized protein YeeX (DUF496 family)
MNEYVIPLKKTIKTNYTYNFHSLIDNPFLFFLYLEHEKKILEVSFAWGSLFYQVTLIEDLKHIPPSHQHLENNFMKYSFFEVKNSSKAKWMASESYFEEKAEDFDHYLIVTNNALIDVISGEHPWFNIITKIDTTRHWTNYPSSIKEEKKILDNQKLYGALDAIERYKSQKISLESAVEKLDSTLRNFEKSWKDNIIKKLNSLQNPSHTTDPSSIESIIKEIKDQIKSQIS